MMHDTVKQYWYTLAEQMGALASNTKSAVTRQALRRIASEYEQFAKQVDGTAVSPWVGANDAHVPRQRKRP